MMITFRLESHLSGINSVAKLQNLHETAYQNKVKSNGEWTIPFLIGFRKYLKQCYSYRLDGHGKLNLKHLKIVT